MLFYFYFVFNDAATNEIYTYGHTLSLHDALPICGLAVPGARAVAQVVGGEHQRLPHRLAHHVVQRVDQRRRVAGHVEAHQPHVHRTRPRVAHADLRRLAGVLGGWHLRQRRRAEAVDVVAALLRARDAVEIAHQRVARAADPPADPLVAAEATQPGAPGE